VQTLLFAGHGGDKTIGLPIPGLAEGARESSRKVADMALDIDFTRRNKKPRLLTDAERDQLDEFIDAIHYSSRYAWW